MAYYTSSTCGYPTAGNSTSVSSGCTTDYKSSEIKYAVDAWATDKFKSSDLKEVDGYKSRLIKLDELLDYMNYSSLSGNGSVGYSYLKTANTPSWIYSSNYMYWTMSQYQDSASYVWSVNSDGNLRSYGSVDDDYGVVRPVINLLKSAI